METTHVSTDRWMNKVNVLYTYTGIQFSLKKEGNPAIHNNMDDLEDIMLSEIGLSEKDKYFMILLT